MADTQQLGIEVVAEVQSAIDDLNSLLETINQFPDTKDTTVDVETENTESVDNLKTDIDSLDNKTVDITVDDGQIVEAQSVSNTLTTDLDDAGTAAIILSSDINDIDPSNLEDAAGDASDLSSNMDDAAGGADDASGAMDGAAQSTSGVGMAAGVASLGVGALVATSINGAGEFGDQWGQIGAVFHETSAKAQKDWGGSINKMTDTTGRGAQDIRGYILGMGIEGVKSKDLLTSSFDDIASASGATGIPLSGMENTLEKVAATGKIGRGTLQQLGLTTDDVGMSTQQLTTKLAGMTASQRTAYLTGLVAAKYGAAGNETYKQSWQHVMDSMSRAGDYMGRILGATVLPAVEWAINAVSWALGGLAGWLDKLHGPGGEIVKIFLGIGFAIVGITLAIVAGAAAWNTLNISSGIAAARATYHAIALGVEKAALVASAFATDGLSGALAVLKGTTVQAIGEADAFSGATDANTLSQEGGIIATVENGISRLALGAYSLIAAGASGVLTAAQWALNIALDANPIAIVILAIAGLVAAFVWAYEKVDWFRNGINWVWDTLKKFGAFLLMTNPFTFWIGALILLYQHFDQIKAVVMNLWHTIASSLEKLWFDINIIWSQIYAFVGNTLKKILDLVDGTDLWKGLTIGIAKVYLSLEWWWNHIIGMVQEKVNWIKSIPADLFDWIKVSIAKAYLAVEWEWNHIIGMVQEKINWIKGLPSEIWGWLTGGVKDAIDKVFKFWGDFTDYLKALPTNMKKWGHDIILGLINGIINAIPGLRQALSAIGLNFPQSPPKEGPLAAVTESGAETWSTGIASAMSKGMNKFNLNKIGGLPKIPSVPGLSNAMNNNQLGGQPIILNVNENAVKIQGNATKDVINNAGTQLGTSIVSAIQRGQISNGGKPTVLARK